MKNYVTKKGLEKLKARVDGLEDRLSRVHADIGEACSESGESWHDNAAYDYLRHEIDILNRRLSDTYQEMANIELVPYPINVDKVCIGCEVDVLKNGEKLTYRVLGYGESNQDGEICEISYQAPLAQAIFGKTVGEFSIFRGNVFQVIGLRTITYEDEVNKQ